MLVALAQSALIRSDFHPLHPEILFDAGCIGPACYDQVRSSNPVPPNLVVLYQRTDEAQGIRRILVWILSYQPVIISMQCPGKVAGVGQDASLAHDSIAFWAYKVPSWLFTHPHLQSRYF